MIDILIPTYNRSDFLKKNILTIDAQIQKYDLASRFQIIISDNCSNDDTWMFLNSLENSINTKISIYRQKKNIGLEPNAIFLLGKSMADHIMYLGDDDYIPDGYLAFVLNAIDNDGAFCVIPGYSNLSPDGSVNPSRTENFNFRKYEAGFETVCSLSNYGHQLSGLVVKRESLYKEYIDHNIYRNIYPFIFFVTYCMMRGVSFYAPKYQVLVSQGNSKNWSYDASGLLIDIFKNYKIAFPEDRDKFVTACSTFVRSQPWRLRAGKNVYNAFKAFLHIFLSREVDRKIKIMIFCFYPSIYISKFKKFILKKMGS